MLGDRAPGIGGKLGKICEDYVGLTDYMVDLQGHKVVAHNHITNNGFIEPRLMVESNDLKLDMRFCHHSVRQMTDKLGVSPAFMAQLFMATDTWKKMLFTHNMNEFIDHSDRRNHLVRMIQDSNHPRSGEMRAFLSDSYKRYDGYGLLVNFIKGVKAYGAEVSSVTYDETRHWVEAIIPEVKIVETKNNGPVPLVFGVRMANSDFGDGAYELKTFQMRVECLNGMTGKRALRQIHIGHKLPADIIVSNKTLELNTEAMVSATNDVVKYLLSEEAIQEQVATIQGASEKEIDTKHALSALPRVGMLKGEIEATRGYLISGDPEDGISGKPTVFKLSQAISRVANDATTRRRTELSDIAGSVLENAAA